MNYNIVAYCLYLFFTFTVIIYVGLVCYKNGKVYSLQIFGGDEELTLRTNNILLLCYYLFNLGYCLINIYNWNHIDNWRYCIESVSQKAGIILTAIGILHLFNILAIIYIAQRKKYSSQ
jgi:hypothetical protein